MAGGPTGLPMLEGSSLNSNFGLAFIATTLPEVSGAPASIQALMIASSASGILGDFGGIFGSSACVTSLPEVRPVEVARLDHLARAAPSIVARRSPARARPWPCRRCGTSCTATGRSPRRCPGSSPSAWPSRRPPRAAGRCSQTRAIARIFEGHGRGPRWAEWIGYRKMSGWVEPRASSTRIRIGGARLRLDPPYELGLRESRGIND